MTAFGADGPVEESCEQPATRRLERRTRELHVRAWVRTRMDRIVAVMEASIVVRQ
jgi:hypothetical protein